MYYPYLRARQFELIALRELVTESEHENLVIPIIEPVRKSFNGLNKANEIFHENRCSPYLIINPLKGDIAGDTNIIAEYLHSLENCSYRPAFHFTNNTDYIRRTIQNYDLTNCMLICLDGFSDNESLRELCEEAEIGEFAVLEPQKYRSLNRYLKELDKPFIRMDDVFVKQKRNADYLAIPANKLTEEHLYYRDEGYASFSDFTVLPSEFIIGGATPRAVVIHLSYINENKNSEIWIRHFTSESGRGDTANVQGKFKEAAQKALDFCETENFNNSAIAELRNYYDKEKYPGLGVIKKISIKNHLIIVRDFLLERHEEHM